MKYLPTTRLQWAVAVLGTAGLGYELFVLGGDLTAMVSSPTCLTIAIACDLAYVWATVRDR